MLSMITSQALADCPQTLDLCLTAETKCKAALDSRNQEIQLCQLAVSKGVEQNSQLSQTIESQDAKLSAFYRNPFFMFGLGVLAAGAVGLLRK